MQTIEFEREIERLTWNELLELNNKIAALIKNRGSELTESSPVWHKDVLEQLDKKVAERRTAYVDWEKAKVELEASLNEN